MAIIQLRGELRRFLELSKLDTFQEYLGFTLPGVLFITFKFKMAIQKEV